MAGGRASAPWAATVAVRSGGAAAWVRDVTCFAYEDVVRDPLRQFSRLAEIGWPIDPRAAAATVDPGLDRNGTAQGARSAAMIGVCTR